MSNQPISASDLRARLHIGIVKFFFVKKDGSLREVIGTTNLTHIPANGHPSGDHMSSHKVVPFWDFIVGGWRSMQVTTQAFLIE